MEQTFWKHFYIPYLAGSIYDEQMYGHEYLGVFGSSACSVPIPIGIFDSHHQLQPQQEGYSCSTGICHYITHDCIRTGPALGTNSVPAMCLSHFNLPIMCVSLTQKMVSSKSAVVSRLTVP